VWKPAIRLGIIFASFIMSVIAVGSLIVSLILQTFVFGYMVGLLTFLATGTLLLFGGCLYARQPLDDDKRYNTDGSPVPSWRRALFGLRLMIASVFLFLYGLLFTIVSMVLGI